MVLGLASMPVGDMWTRAWILLVGYVFTLIGVAATFVFFGVHPSAWSGLALIGVAEIVWGSSHDVPASISDR